MNECDFTKRLESYHLPRYEEIPGVGLYLNQVAKYMNEYLIPLGDAEITESMISNYVKKKLIRSPQKKQYDREQIAALFMIAVFKLVLSLEDVAALQQLKGAVFGDRDGYERFAEDFMQVLRGETLKQQNPCSSSAEDYELLYRAVIDAAVRKLYLDARFRELKEPDKE